MPQQHNNTPPTKQKLWKHIAAMATIVILIAIIVRYGIDYYTNHGRTVMVPDIVHQDFEQAADMLDDVDLKIVVSDTGYVKSLPADYVLEQSLTAGTIVKPGRIVYVTINSAHSPTLTLPDIIDNSSYRTAVAKLKAMGFKLAKPELIPGEKDWVYGVKCKGRQLATGQKVPIEELLTLQVGDGRRDLNDSVTYIDPIYEYEEPADSIKNHNTDTSEHDDFEVVTEPE